MSTQPVRLDSGVLVRDATTEDAAALLRYLDYVGGETDFLTFGAGEFNYTEERERAFLAASASNPTSLFLVACDGDDVIGSLTSQAGHRARTSHLATFGISVARAYWGQGIGSQMMRTYLAWASRTPPLRKVQLEVHAQNVRAIAMYLRFGFVVEGTTRMGHWAGGDEFWDVYSMGLILSPHAVLGASS